MFLSGLGRLIASYHLLSPADQTKISGNTVWLGLQWRRWGSFNNFSFSADLWRSARALHLYQCAIGNTVYLALHATSQVHPEKICPSSKIRKPWWDFPQLWRALRPTWFIVCVKGYQKVDQRSFAEPFQWPRLGMHWTLLYSQIFDISDPRILDLKWDQS